MKAYQEATDFSKQLFDSGMVNYLEVITAEVSRLNAELSVAEAQFTRMTIRHYPLQSPWRWLEIMSLVDKSTN